MKIKKAHIIVYGHDHTAMLRWEKRGRTYQANIGWQGDAAAPIRGIVTSIPAEGPSMTLNVSSHPGIRRDAQQAWIMAGGIEALQRAHEENRVREAEREEKRLLAAKAAYISYHADMAKPELEALREIKSIGLDPTVPYLERIYRMISAAHQTLENAAKGNF